MSDVGRTRPQQSRRYPWYDSIWLERYVEALDIIRQVAPETLDEFESAFLPLRTRADFEVVAFDEVFEGATVEAIRSVVSSVEPDKLELHEARRFRRFVVHDEVYFTQLQAQLVPTVSEAVGELVEPAYNFLSLYGPTGVCPVHLDSPQAKWTLDFCIDQTSPWPIYISQVRPWPEADEEFVLGEDWELEIKEDPSLDFTRLEMTPGQAVLFSGSSQWHYREPMPVGTGPQHCDLLFFHFVPAGEAGLVDPDNWATLFGIPELQHE